MVIIIQVRIDQQWIQKKCSMNQCFKLIIHELMYPNMTKNDLDDFVNAFIKVETYADQLVDVKKKV